MKVTHHGADVRVHLDILDLAHITEEDNFYRPVDLMLTLWKIERVPGTNFLLPACDSQTCQKLSRNPTLTTPSRILTASLHQVEAPHRLLSFRDVTVADIAVAFFYP